MSIFIEIHLIHSLQASNPNRGADGGVKDINYGGVLRARLSSQAQKRAARMFYRESVALRGQMATRSRRHSIALSNLLNDWEGETERLLVARMALNLFNISADKFLSALLEKDSNLLFLSDHEIVTLSELIKQNKEDFEKLLEIALDYLQHASKNLNDKGEPVPPSNYDRNITKKDLNKLKKSVVNQFKSAIPGEVALFGRMMANLVETSVDGCVQVAHALGVSELPRPRGSDSWSSGSIDFYSAVDDIAPIEEEGSGAGMIGEVRFTAPTYYRYANVNISEFCRLVGDQGEDCAPEMIGAFLEGFVKSLPSGYGNSFAHQTMPDLVLIQVKDTCPYQYSGAFEEIIFGPDAQGKGISRQAVCRLLDYRKQVLELYGDEPLYSSVTALPTHYMGEVKPLKNAICDGVTEALNRSRKQKSQTLLEVT